MNVSKNESFFPTKNLSQNLPPFFLFFFSQVNSKSQNQNQSQKSKSSLTQLKVSTKYSLEISANMRIFCKKKHEDFQHIDINTSLAITLLLKTLSTICAGDPFWKGPILHLLEL